MTYPTPGMQLVASERFTGYHDPALIPDYPEERDPVRNPETDVLIGTTMLVVSVHDTAVCVVMNGTLVWIPRPTVDRHTVISTAVFDEDVAYLLELDILGQEPDTIWAPP